MAYKGQIMTVSDVLTNGTVDEYILGADANVFQTNYDNEGVLTDWSIGNDRRGAKIYTNGDELWFQTYYAGDWITKLRIKKDDVRIGALNGIYPKIHLNSLSNIISLDVSQTQLLLGEQSFDLATGSVSIHAGSFQSSNTITMEGPEHKINITDNNMFIGPKTGSNYIYYSGNSRPYFGSNGSNYVVSNTDINDMATKTWSNTQFSLKSHNHNDDYYTKSYIDSNYYRRTQLSDLYQTKLPQTGSTFNINISGAAYSASLATEATGASGTNFATHAEANYGPSLVYCIGRLDSRGLEIVGANNIGTFMVEYYYSSTRGRYEFKYGNGHNPLRLEGSVLTANDSINVTSDITLKDNIQTFGQEEEQFYLSLKPCKYHLKKNKKDNFSYGFIAQEVQQSEKDNLSYDTDFIDGEKILSLNYNNFISLSTYMVQKQHQEIETLKTEIAEIKELLKNK